MILKLMGNKLKLGLKEISMTTALQRRLGNLQQQTCFTSVYVVSSEFIAFCLTFTCSNMKNYMIIENL